MKQLSAEQITGTAMELAELSERAETLDDQEVEVNRLVEELQAFLLSRNLAAALYNRSVERWNSHLQDVAGTVDSDPWRESIQELSVPAAQETWSDPPALYEFSDLFDPQLVTLQATEPAA